MTKPKPKDECEHKETYIHLEHVDRCRNCDFAVILLKNYISIAEVEKIIVKVECCSVPARIGSSPAEIMKWRFELLNKQIRDLR